MLFPAEGQDYQFTTQNIVFNNTIRTVCFNVTIISQPDITANLMFTLSLSNADPSITVEFPAPITVVTILDESGRSINGFTANTLQLL